MPIKRCLTDAKPYVSIVTLSAEDNAKLSKLLTDGFKRTVYWNEYKVIDNKIVEIAANNDEKDMRKLLYSSCQGVKRLFVLSSNNKEGDDKVSVDSFKKYFLPRVKIENCNMEIDRRNFQDHPINDSIKLCDKIRKISTGEGNDYATGCLLEFDYFEKNYRVIASDLSKQRALDADSRAIQQIIFTGKIKATEANTRVIIYFILEKLKETILQFAKGTTKVFDLPQELLLTTRQKTKLRNRFITICQMI